MNIDKNKLLEWLRKCEKENLPTSPYDDYHHGMQKVIDELVCEIEDGELDVKEGSHD